MEKDIWKWVNKDSLRMRESNLLRSFLNIPHVKTILEQENTETDAYTRYCKELNEKFSVLEKMYLIRNAYLDGRVIELDKKYGKNLETYLEDYFARAKMYLILLQIFQGKYEMLKDLFASEWSDRRFAPNAVYLQNYCNPDPIIDLVIGNISKKKMYKGIPRDLTEKEEYRYGEKGRLIWYISYDENGDAWKQEFFFYCKDYVLRVQYGKNGEVERIVIQKYREDTISEVENVQFILNHICEVALGKFNFEEDRIEGIEENYHFPDLSNKSSGVLRDKNIYEFRIDTDGYIYGYSVSTWIGDGFRPSVWDGHLFELSEKEKKDTGKDAGRWRKPVCPDI